MPVEIRVPQLGESVVEATVLRWVKQEGSEVTAGEPVVELETDKVNVEVPAPASGAMGKVARQEGETVAVNDVLGTVLEGVAGKPRAAAAAIPSNGDGRSHPSASPVAQRLAAEHNVDMRSVAGTGPGGKVLKEDVEAALEQPQRSRAKAAPSDEIVHAEPVPSPAPSESGAALVAGPAGADAREERVKLSRRRLAIMRNLKQAQNTAAILTTFNEIDMTAVSEIRRRRKEGFQQRHGISLGLMSFFTRAVVGALKSFPMLNAEIADTDVIIKRHYDIGIAVGTDEGLVVPVVRDADRKTFAQIEREVADLAARARERKLTLDELQGGTFSITNGGYYGSLLATPILNYPQVGILGMHRIEERPVVVNGEIAVRPMMYVALSYDHRIVDGSESVRFLVRVKEMIENPEELLLEG